MCGIFGLYTHQLPANVAMDYCQQALITLVARGSDDQGTWQSDDTNITLGHTRLSIIDLSQAAHQPMTQDGLSLVFNGCIYNYQALRQQLMALGHSSQSASDTEVLLMGYRQWGDQVVDHLDGMFAFTIVDQQRQRLFMARDRLGIKPFYYAYDAASGQLGFSSNTQGLLALPWVSRELSPQALRFQFTLHGVVPPPYSIFRDVQKLEPGHTLTLDYAHPKPKLHKQVYWTLKAQRPDHTLTDQDWQDLLADKLMQAVKKRLDAADVPVGVLLSGGLDSSLIVALLAEAGASDLRTFSIGFEDIGDEAGSEFIYSDQVVNRYQTQHQKIFLSNDQVLPQLPHAIAHMNEPMFAQDAVAFYLLSEQVSQSVKVVQSGQGADEVFAGYFWYPRMNQAFAQSRQHLSSFAPHYFDRSDQEWMQMIHPDWHHPDVVSPFIEQHLKAPQADEYMDSVLRLDTTRLITDDPVKRVDNMTMAWGLEARVPFLDSPLVEAAFQCPPTAKLADGGKGILKRIARGKIPDEVIDRKKGYFPMPALKYVQGDFLDMMKDTLNSTACRNRHLYQRSYVQFLIDQPTAPSSFTAIQGSKLWHLAVLELWCQQHVDLH